MQPVENVTPPVADGPADAESTRPGSKVPPVAQRGDGRADDGSGFSDGQQFVVLAIGLGFSVMVRSYLVPMVISKRTQEVREWPREVARIGLPADSPTPR